MHYTQNCVTQYKHTKCFNNIISLGATQLRWAHAAGHKRVPRMNCMYLSEKKAVQYNHFNLIQILITHRRKQAIEPDPTRASCDSVSRPSCTSILGLSLPHNQHSPQCIEPCFSLIGL